MIAWQDRDKRLLHHRPVLEIRFGLLAQERDIDLAAHQIVGKRRRKSARHPDLEIGQLIGENACCAREPCDFLSGQESDGEDRFGGPAGAARGVDGGLCLGEREPGVVEESPACLGQFDALHAALQKLRADLIFEVADLTAQRRLRRVKALLRRELHAPRLRDRDEVAQMPKLHGHLYIRQAYL